jgi:spoIIIJ-associated protein
MTNRNSVEATAATVEEAVRDALDQLGLGEEDVIIEVLATPRSGVLGVGSREARVRVTYRPPPAARSGVTSPPPAAAPAKHEPARKAPERMEREEKPAAAAREAEEEEPRAEAERGAPGVEQVREAKSVLEKILELMGERAEVREAGATAEAIELDIKGDGSGILIGRHGQTLDALEYVVNRILARRVKDSVPVILETEAYRARRRQQLQRMALSMGERAKREHQTVKLEPMPPRDRRVIHLALKDDPLLSTRSTGEGFMRAVEIVPVEPRRERDGRAKQRGRGYAVGEAGGFKHGQKKII